jgi:hypothetical protein
MKRLSSDECLERYGEPKLERNMFLWMIPDEFAFVGRDKVYINRDMAEPLYRAFENIVAAGLEHEFRTFDGCFCIRKKRGQSSQSLHSWGMAVDINASSNQFGHEPAMSPELVACFEKAGFEWGGNWSVPDGMHFQPWLETLKPRED